MSDFNAEATRGWFAGVGGSIGGLGFPIYM